MASTISVDVTLGERLRLERTRQGMRLDHAAAAAQQLLPTSLSMSRELLRRLEAGLIPEERANPVHLAALARVYGISLRELHPASADIMAIVVSLSDKQPEPTPPAGGSISGESQFACTRSPEESPIVRLLPRRPTSEPPAERVAA